jgi:hypothetical protein
MLQELESGVVAHTSMDDLTGFEHALYRSDVGPGIYR